ALSFRTIRQALEDGPPQADGQAARPRAQGGGAGGRRGLSSDQYVEAALFDLAAGWRAQGFSDAAIYTTLAVVVMPPGRQDDVFLYSRPLSDGILGAPRSGARLLVEAAVRTRKLDDLRARARVRQKKPGTLLPARVLLALACLAGDDAAGVSE